MAGKRYYWLQLKEDFFSSKRIKKLRKLAGGDTFTIIYLKMQLLAMKTDGILRWTGLEDSFADELALDLDEAPENVEITLNYLLSCGLAESSDNINFFLPYAVENVGSESSSAQRMRAARAKQKELSSTMCNDGVTLCAHSDGETESYIEPYKELYIESETKAQNGSLSEKTNVSVDEVRTYISEKGLHIDSQRFWSYYEARGWRLNGEPIRNWKALAESWEQNERNKPAECKQPNFDMSELQRAVDRI